MKAVLFDLDGTLIDTNNLILKTYKYVLKKELNLEVEDSELIMYFGEPLLKTMKRYDEEKAEDLIKAYFEYNETIHDTEAVEIEGARNTLKALKEIGYKVGIVTSKRKVMAERGLKLFNLMEFIDVIVTPEYTEKHKPNPEPVLKCCELLGVLPIEAIMVGDSHFDIMCGKNAGAKTCLVKYSMLPLEALMKHEPDYTIDKLSELIDIIGA